MTLQLLHFLQQVLQEKTTDDQKGFNNQCFNNLVVRDHAKTIFYNELSMNTTQQPFAFWCDCPPVHHHDAVFVSFPGSGGCGGSAGSA